MCMVVTVIFSQPLSLSPLESLWPVLDELKSMGLSTELLYDTLFYHFCYQKDRARFVPEVTRKMFAEVGVSMFGHTDS